MKKLYWLAVGFAIALTLCIVAACVGTVNADWNIKRQQDFPEFDAEATIKQEGFFTGLAAGILGGAIAGGTSLANYFFAKNTQDKTWEREDTAIQRRVADLKAAGLSPTLAAGSAASSGVTSAPQLNGNAVSDALASAMQVADIKNKRQENANLKTADEKMKSEMTLNFANAQKAFAEKAYFDQSTLTSASDAILKGYMGQELLQRIAESKERSKGYQYQAENNHWNAQQKYWSAANEALDNTLINLVGMRSSVGGMSGLLKPFARAGSGLMDLFKQDTHIPLKNNFKW